MIMETIRYLVKRNTVNYLVDVGLAFSFLLSAVTGFLKYQGVPRFLVRYSVYLPTNAITRLHEWAGAILAGLVLFHLVLHWKWLVKTTGSLLRYKRGEGSQ